MAKTKPKFLDTPEAYVSNRILLDAFFPFVQRYTVFAPSIPPAFIILEYNGILLTNILKIAFLRSGTCAPKSSLNRNV